MPITFLKNLDNAYIPIDVNYFDKKAKEQQQRHDATRAEWSKTVQGIADNPYLDDFAKQQYLLYQQNLYNEVIQKNKGNLSKGYSDILGAIEQTKLHPYHNLNARQLAEKAAEEKLQAEYGARTINLSNVGSQRLYTLGEDGKPQWANANDIQANVIQADEYDKNIEAQLKEISAHIYSNEGKLGGANVSGNTFYLANLIQSGKTLTFEELQQFASDPAVQQAFLANNPSSAVDNRMVPGRDITYKQMFSDPTELANFIYGNIIDERVDEHKLSRNFVTNQDAVLAQKHANAKAEALYIEQLKYAYSGDAITTNKAGNTILDEAGYEGMLKKKDIFQQEEDDSKKSLHTLNKTAWEIIGTAPQQGSYNTVSPLIGSEENVNPGDPSGMNIGWDQPKFDLLDYIDKQTGKIDTYKVAINRGKPLTSQEIATLNILGNQYKQEFQKQKEAERQLVYYNELNTQITENTWDDFLMSLSPKKRNAISKEITAEDINLIKSYSPSKATRTLVGINPTADIWVQFDYFKNKKIKEGGIELNAMQYNMTTEDANHPINSRTTLLNKIAEQGMQTLGDYQLPGGSDVLSSVTVEGKSLNHLLQKQQGYTPKELKSQGEYTYEVHKALPMPLAVGDTYNIVIKKNGVAIKNIPGVTRAGDKSSENSAIETMNNAATYFPSSEVGNQTRAYAAQSYGQIRHGAETSDDILKLKNKPVAAGESFNYATAYKLVNGQEVIVDFKKELTPLADGSIIETYTLHPNGKNPRIFKGEAGLYEMNLVLNQSLGQLDYAYDANYDWNINTYSKSTDRLNLKQRNITNVRDRSNQMVNEEEE